MEPETSNYVSLKALYNVLSDTSVKEIKDYEERYKKLLSVDDRTQFRKTYVRLANTEKILLPLPLQGYLYDVRDRLINCSYHRPCGLYLCPSCRKLRQLKAGERATSFFLSKGHDNLRFVTVLLPAIRDVSDYLETQRRYKRSITRALDKECSDCSFMGAFEIDHKIPNNFWFSGPRTKDLYTSIGITDFKSDWYTPHLHMIGFLPSEKHTLLLREALEQAIWKGKPPARSIRIEKFRQTKANTKKYGPVLSDSQDLGETLVKTAHYMFKARLQYTWQQYEQSSSKGKTIRTAYSNRTYTLLSLLSLVKEIDDNGGFKGMKFDYRMVRRGKSKSVLATTEPSA